MPDRFSPLAAAVDANRRGEMVIVVDDEDRENEGDFVCAAEKVSPEIVNFMIRHGRGQVCMPILPDLASRLELPMMVEANSTPLGTAFTVPVDHVSSRTGITAAERSTTITAILDPTSRPTDSPTSTRSVTLLATKTSTASAMSVPLRREVARAR
jgi:3,4-dihydroxy 2-butanone 4-phosphate synthase/GTP cyclohydrolase II